MRFKFFKSKRKRKEEALQKQYEEGKFLQIGNGVDNKEYIKNLS